MPHKNESPAAIKVSGGAIGNGGSGDILPLIRYSHIFSSAVREILEVKLLEEIGAEHLTLHQFHLLKLITLNGKHQMGEVADFLGVTPPAATKNIDKLEGLGLVARGPCEGDRRATLLAPSRKGHNLVDRYEASKRKRLAPVLEEFSTEELTDLVSLLQRFSIALIRTESADEGLCLRCSAYFDDSCPVQHLHDGCPYQKIVASKRGTATVHQEVLGG